MKFIANKIHWVGIVMLVGFAAAAAGLYFDVPARGLKKPVPAEASAEQYVCPMHPNVVSAKPGDCPDCGMALKLRSAVTSADAAHAGCGAAEAGDAADGCCGSKAPQAERVLPPGHPPIAGYTIQADSHAGCNHGAAEHSSATKSTEK